MKACRRQKSQSLWDFPNACFLIRRWTVGIGKEHLESGPMTNSRYTRRPCAEKGGLVVVTVHHGPWTCCVGCGPLSSLAKTRWSLAEGDSGPQLHQVCYCSPLVPAEFCRPGGTKELARGEGSIWWGIKKAPSIISEGQWINTKQPGTFKYSELCIILTASWSARPALLRLKMIYLASISQNAYLSSANARLPFVLRKNVCDHVAHNLQGFCGSS